MNWHSIALLVPLAVWGQSITGRFVDPVQASVGKVSVELLPVGGDRIAKSTQTDPNGIFRLSPVEPGDYVLYARVAGFRGRVLAVHVSNRAESNVGTLVLEILSCESPGVSCDYFGPPLPPRAPPPIPVVDLCECLRSPERYGNKWILIVGNLTSLDGLLALTADCDGALGSGALTWINAVLLPWQSIPQDSRGLPDIPNLKATLRNLATSVRKSDGSTSRVAAVYGFLNIPNGLAAVQCKGGSCSHPDIRMPPASFLRVDGFQELK